jgi:hypothetical protein
LTVVLGLVLVRLRGRVEEREQGGSMRREDVLREMKTSGWMRMDDGDGGGDVKRKR